ncbi:C-type LECtin [Caenorhabditis elegans]|uniref:C-type LECtin n=1 Tax=Caenorhabditis elegans TaxID=6239 RepID=Q19230_CAEEL|nr:C-type LECtin [Caenorhabditis elegans]CAB01151.2 C-type LECtin [Caenorhabditis elegans]|eukprot:NP_506589.2 C-type LECtin [Caenorhabditis elegans]
MIIAVLTGLLFASVFQGTYADTNHCPLGWTFSTNTSYCYTKSAQYFSFSEAANYCQSIGGTQVFIISSTELSWLTDFTSSSLAQPWVATTRNTTNNKWYNTDGSSPYSFFWTTGEPSLNGDCATFKGTGKAGLKAVPCYSIQPAVCKQMPALCPTQTSYGGLYTRSGTITSPGYPTQYYNNLNCLYSIKSPNNTYITMEFSPYLVQSYFDYINVYDGPNSTSTYLGTTDDGWDDYWWDSRRDFESSNNSISFVFRTDSSVTNKGWQLTWSAKPNTPPIKQSGQSGNFTSPNYPLNYDPYSEQLYYITAPTGFQINVTIPDFATEKTYDVLEIYNASYASNYRLVANLSGTAVAPWSWVSPTNYVTMKFKSDSAFQMKGFSIVWFIQ